MYVVSNLSLIAINSFFLAISHDYLLRKCMYCEKCTSPLNMVFSIFVNFTLLKNNCKTQ